MFSFLRKHRDSSPTKEAVSFGFDCQTILSKMLPLFDDGIIDEVVCNGPNVTWAISSSSKKRVEGLFASNGEMVRWIQEFSFLNKVRLDPLCPSAGGEIEQGRFRWHAMIPPLSKDGALFSMRRHRLDSLCVDDFQISQGNRDQLIKIAEKRLPLLICGPTASGKSSLLTALLREFALDERVFVLEQLSEIPLLSNAWVRLVESTESVDGVGAYSLTDIFRQVLRLRPDRIVVGEIRGSEAWPFLSALMTGHSGVMGTIHAGSPQQAIKRLMLLAGADGERGVGDICSLIGDNVPLYVANVKRGTPPEVTCVQRGF